MTRDAIRTTLEKLKKLVDLGRWMEPLRRSDRPADVETAREIMIAAQPKARALVEALLAAPEPFAAWAQHLGEELQVALSATTDPDAPSLAACDRADALLAEALAEARREG